MKKPLSYSRGIALLGLCSVLAFADEVTDWNQIMIASLRTAGAGGIAATRPAAIVQSAVFDALNGIERRYAPIHVPPAAPTGASRAAAVVQAAYASLVLLFPAQATDLGVKRAAALAALASRDAAENSVSIARGIEWGQAVATTMVAWRNTDGFSPPWAPFVGGNAVGQWRPTPPAFPAMAVPQLGFTTPWVLTSPVQFPLAGPSPLGSTRYTQDFDEVKSLGAVNSATRTTEQTALARFWASGSSPNFYWNQLAIALGEQRHTTMSENARLLALINIAIADAAIVVWRAKYDFAFWRPITAIRLASTDGNAATIEDAAWTPLLTTPPYPDYPSGLCGTSAAGVGVLAAYFGENTSFDVVSDSPTMVGVARHFTNFSTSLGEMIDVRVWSGIHFRTADEDAVLLGTAVANYVLSHACLPLHGERNGQVGK